MIVDIVMFILRQIINVLVFILDFLAGNLTVWPETVLNGLTYFFTNLMKFDFILNSYQMLLAIKFLVLFLIVYVPAKLIVKLVNFIRGSGSLEV